MVSPYWQYRLVVRCLAVMRNAFFRIVTMLNSLGVVKKIAKIVEWEMQKNTFANNLERFFSDKTVVVVGSSPELIGAKLGAFIDAHDLVVRINGVSRIQNPEDFGGRTDCIFLGGTFLSQQDLRHRLSETDNDFLVISTQKNKLLINNFFRFKNIFYFPTLLPQKISKEVERSLGCQLWSKPFRPPRSGFVTVATIQKFARPKTISVIGMSNDSTLARKTIDGKGMVRDYDERILLGKHCDPSVEIHALRTFVKMHDNINWVTAS